MKNIILTTALVCMISHSPMFGQNNTIAAFSNLVGGVWVFEGRQLAGHEGRTEYHFESGLDGEIVKLKLYSTDPKTLEFGLRNEGIRAWNAADSLVHFYEFDKYGNISTGIVTSNKNDIHYDYEYQGTMLRDSWEYIDTDTYMLTVGIWDSVEWRVKLYQAKFVREK